MVSTGEVFLSLRVLTLAGCALLACLAIGTASAAQETINQGTIGGRVLDAQGAAVPGALVTVRHTDTGVTIEATADTNGRFRFPYLRIGPYELRAKLQGFKEHARTLVLSAGSAFDLPITLDVAGLDTAVTVVADILSLETARSQIVRHRAASRGQNLPMNGRNFLDLALLVPGVSPTNTNSTQLFAETSALPGQDYRSPASAISRTASSLTECRQTTTRLA